MHTPGERIACTTLPAGKPLRGAPSATNAARVDESSRSSIDKNKLFEKGAVQRQRNDAITQRLQLSTLSFADN